MNYILGVVFGISAGISNFTGQILQKKAINDLKKIKSDLTMPDLIKRPLWITGMLSILVLGTLLLTFAQLYIGAALIPGLMASGFIVLAIGSVKLLGEQLKKEEIIAIALLIVGIVMISLSKLTIEGSLERFNNRAFLLRIFIVSGVLILVWLTLFYGGRRTSKKAVLMALGAGLPFVIANIWMQPFLLFVGALFKGELAGKMIIIAIIATIMVAVTNIVGIVHLQQSMAEGNASIVIPFQQIPQQLSPLIIYFIVYLLAAPGAASYAYLGAGMLITITAGFILSKRQSELESVINT
ncbi:MAG: hypothetical protein ACOX3U_01875 [Christensenellales bacterium]|jgi:multidrug transporter EmrE-like cation transporter